MIEKSDRRLATLNLCFLAFIALLPFSTDLLADFLQYKAAILVYWLNLLMLGITLLASWRYGDRSGLLGHEVGAETKRAVYQRIIKAQLLWALGAALCFVSPLVSLSFFLIVQLTYAISPRAPMVRRIIG